MRALQVMAAGKIVPAALLPDGPGKQRVSLASAFFLYLLNIVEIPDFAGFFGDD